MLQLHQTAWGLYRRIGNTRHAREYPSRAVYAASRTYVDLTRRSSIGPYAREHALLSETGERAIIPISTGNTAFIRIFHPFMRNGPPQPK
ncbi:hypothetical protein A2635_01455 [Candidatus Peribacteria bacterium RIFCSPHIGHO2_01_FULL_51_9]|nr:MAG: hypothetical protein A2635_01455 [Candidatus Peribacteria bacterium RIFCSPHIGHO2_01_FULL_51_9]